MLTTVDEGLVAGIRNVDWDAVELPSQFMENFCYEVRRAWCGTKRAHRAAAIFAAHAHARTAAHRPVHHTHPHANVCTRTHAPTHKHVQERTLYSFAKHHATGEPLPRELYERLKAAKNFRSGALNPQRH